MRLPALCLGFLEQQTEPLAGSKNDDVGRGRSDARLLRTRTTPILHPSNLARRFMVWLLPYYVSLLFLRKAVSCQSTFSQLRAQATKTWRRNGDGIQYPPLTIPRGKCTPPAVNVMGRQPDSSGHSRTYRTPSDWPMPREGCALFMPSASKPTVVVG